MSQLLLSFYGDDFTGSTDAMESLEIAGVHTVLFTDPPTAEQIAAHPKARAIGVAGTTRSMSPADMGRTLWPALESLRAHGAPIVHYKVCSTFDSSPTIGSIGCVLEIGEKIFPSRPIPMVVGAPALGRYCVFGNLFARCGSESEPYRLDRHPSMSRHPVTPMDEADLRAHLRKQTDRPVALFDVRHLDLPADESAKRFKGVLSKRPTAVLIDLLYENQLSLVGQLIEGNAASDSPTFVVGSSGVESALCTRWLERALIQTPAPLPAAKNAGPIVAICGSCSPVTAAQIDWAIQQGFAEVALDLGRVDVPAAVVSATHAIEAGQSVVIHTRGAGANRVSELGDHMVGQMLGTILRDLLGQTRCRRVLVAGGDTSGRIGRALGIQSLEMIGKLTRGSPLCRVTAPGSPADGLEMTFKGGQIGKVDFFTQVEEGRSDV